MNANENSPKADARLQRIKVVGRIIRIPIFVMFIYFVYVAIIQFAQTSSMLFQLLASLSVHVPIYIHPWDLFNYLIQNIGVTVILAIWYWKLARLFRLYERGFIFASENVRCIKILGLLWIAQWTLKTIHQFVFNYYSLPSLRSSLPTKVASKLKEEMFSGNVNLFPFPFWNINFGPLLAGIVIILIAWIMDEGRKIQEEQELTV